MYALRPFGLWMGLSSGACSTVVTLRQEGEHFLLCLEMQSVEERRQRVGYL